MDLPMSETVNPRPKRYWAPKQKQKMLPQVENDDAINQETKIIGAKSARILEWKEVFKVPFQVAHLVERIKLWNSPLAFFWEENDSWDFVTRVHLSASSRRMKGFSFMLCVVEEWG